MHMLAKNMAATLAAKVHDTCKVDFGQTFEYIEAFMGRIKDEFLTVERYIPGGLYIFNLNFVYTPFSICIFKNDKSKKKGH